MSLPCTIPAAAHQPADAHEITRVLGDLYPVSQSGRRGSLSLTHPGLSGNVAVSAGSGASSTAGSTAFALVVAVSDDRTILELVTSGVRLAGHVPTDLAGDLVTLPVDDHGRE